MEFKDLLARFGDAAQQTDGGYLALCPGHGDSRPSLRIWVGDDGKVRITCRAGCAPSDVVAAAGLRWPDLFNVTGAEHVVPAAAPLLVGVAHTRALHDYIGTTSAALLGDARAAGYMQRRFGLDSATADELGIGVDRSGGGHALEWRSRAFTAFPRLTVPLRNFAGLAQGLQGRDLSGDCPGRWLSLSNPEGHYWSRYGVFRGSGGYSAILVTEGPGDGLTAVAVGYDVLMIRGAALAGSPELAAELAAGLRGYQVIACGDADAAGQAFNAKLAAALDPHGIDVHALSLPAALGPKGDLTDWRALDREGFAGALHDAVGAARPVKAQREAAAEAVATEMDARTGTDVVSRDDGHEAARILAGLVDRYGDTDVMNAHALVAWSDGRIRHASGLGFYVWNGQIWEGDSGGHLVRQEIHRMAAALMMAGKVKEAKPFATTSRIDDLMTELRSVPSVRVSADAFDARADRLSFANGTVDLRTGKLGPHQRDDMITYRLDVCYSPEAKCPAWERFLAEVMPGKPEMPAYLQRLIGYGITGDTSEQCFAVLWGKGGNGKSVFTDALRHIFSATAKTTAFATFEEKAGGGIPNDIAALRAARLVFASEGKSGKPMDESTLKNITGGDLISARFLRKEFFEFKPRFLILLGTNHKPKFMGQDDGIWRRVKLIPWTRRFSAAEAISKAEMDHTFQVREAEGVAAWAVRGAVEWFAAGLQDPECISAATLEYRETSDALSGFFPGVLERAEGSKMLGSDAFNAYLDWAEAENLPQRERWKRTTFYDAMEERQVSRSKTNKGITLTGIRLAAQQAPQVGPGIFGRDND